jgi:large subunit ribosomal protein L9
MQVLLRNTVAHLGKPGDIVSVKPGYARNYLVPRGLAIPVKEGDLKAVDVERKRLQRIADRERKEKEELAATLRDRAITITMKANEEGILFGSVGPEQVAERLTAEITPVDASTVRLEEHIKALGAYDVVLHLSPEVEVTVKVNVVGEPAETA